LDPQGNAALIQYDANFRVTAITDAVGQTSSISYISNTVGNAGFYKISQIQDPFSRACNLAYDSGISSVISITDVIGNASAFVYDANSSFIILMTTPYGSTSFYQYVPNWTSVPGKGLRVSFPDGTSSVIENYLGTLGRSYFWDREATSRYPTDPAKLDFSHSQTIQWLMQG